MSNLQFTEIPGTVSVVVCQSGLGGVWECCGGVEGFGSCCQWRLRVTVVN